MENDLYHYGTKGMKWGVRRYQNHDGSLTSAGKKRYGSADLSDKSDAEMQEVVKRKSLEKAYRKATQDDTSSDMERKKKVLDAAKNEMDALTNLDRRIPNRKRKDMDLSNMTDKEMRDAINRKLLEKQYNDMFNESNVNRGRECLRTILEVGTATLGVASSALSIALAIRELRKGIG